MRRDGRSHGMDKRFLFTRKITQDEYLQHGPKRSALDKPGMDLNTGKFREKASMHDLNDRLAAFIEKVRHLEHQNHLLEREIGEIRGKANPASRLEEEYGPELRSLRQLVQSITRQKHQIEIEHRHLEEDLSNLRRQRERESRSRSDAESDIAVLKRDVSDAYQTKLQLDKKAQGLVEEIRLLKMNHEAEVSQMSDRIRDARVTVTAREFGDSGVTAALGDIRAQLEGHAASDVQQMGETFRSQLARLTEAAERKREALKTSQRELREHRRRLQAKDVELDCAEGTREALETQLHDVEDRHMEDIVHYQNTIKGLENELINCKFDMSGYLREYQDVLNVKTAMDVEILSYRKLLCGEEARLSTMPDAHVSLPYIYHQSPIYTLPCLGRPGGPHRRAEPRYKFVEEIITETTREIEMSEFEETGSEETEVEKDEWTKRDRGGGEEEEDDKDYREDEGEQMSDGEEIRGASGANVMNGSDDGTPGEMDDGESEAVDNEGESCIDANKADKTRTVHKYLTSNTGYLKPEITVEDELVKKSDAKKGDADKDNFTSAQVKKPVDETPTQVSKESHANQEPSSVQVQEKVPSSETTEKAADFTAETKSTLTVETEEVSGKPQVSSSTTSKSKEKANSHTEPKEISKSEVAKGEDGVAKDAQDARHGSNKGQDKESSLM